MTKQSSYPYNFLIIIGNPFRFMFKINTKTDKPYKHSQNKQSNDNIVEIN